MKYYFHEEAERELNSAIDYYNEVQPGLGAAFLGEVTAAIENILAQPMAWHPLSANTRRCLTNKFPFGIVYQPLPEAVYIIAVMHLSREPGYWQKRR